MRFVRSLAFYLGLGVATLLLPLIIFVTIPQPILTRQRILARWSGTIITMLRFFCRVDFQVQGTENIPDGPAIILCKHQSAWETFALQVILPAQTWVLKRELLWIPIFGWALAMAQAIAIDRGNPKQALQQVINKGLDRLEKGLWVVIFPEGTRSRPGQKLKYNAGGAILATRTGYPIVPVAHNAGYYWSPSQFTIAPGRIQVIIGPTIDAQGGRASAINAQTEQWIEEAMHEIIP